MLPHPESAASEAALAISADMAQIQAARQNTLDTFLEELPEIPAGYFSFPVDDFFDNYVEELGQRGGQGSGGLPSGSNPPPGGADATLVIAMTTLVVRKGAYPVVISKRTI